LPGRDPRDLIAAAAAIYDRTQELGEEARRVRAFGGGARWMAIALARVRAEERHASEARSDPTASEVGWTGFAGPGFEGSVASAPARLGYIKYGAALACTSVVLASAILVSPWLAIAAIPAFYAIEAQMVFLFPIAIDGAPSPFAASRALTVRAGGTLRVMRTVMPIAASMVFGGCAGRGFLRSWCVGCLAVCVWYERVR
jgi:hypothetical protein